MGPSELSSEQEIGFKVADLYLRSRVIFRPSISELPKMLILKCTHLAPPRPSEPVS